MRGASKRSTLRVGFAPLALAALASLSACNDTPTADIDLVTGDETDVFSRAPVPTSLVIEEVAVDGTVTQLAQTALPTNDAISLGDKGRTDVGSLRVTATDATGKVVVRGESSAVQYGALEGTPLQVFVQRTGELARMPNGPEVLDAPFLGVTVSRYLVAASGTTVWLYDLLRLQALSGIPALPRTAKSFVTFGTAAIVIDDTAATTIDLSSQVTSELVAPVGGTFAEIAGGSTLYVSDGSSFIVGGTRTSAPSSRVLAITSAGIVAFATLATPRQGACAAWIPARGLLVYGGTTDPKAPGAELIAPNQTLGTALPFAGDAVKRCGATALDGSHVLIAGGAGSAVDVKGAAPARVLDLGCTADCKLTAWTGSMPLVRAEAFPLAPDAALVVGDDATGASRAFRITPKTSTEVTIKAPRKGARIVALPVTGTLAVVGGAAPIEQYVE